jgi:ABC-type multidrug transport system fused ATPase/permease subunit
LAIADDRDVTGLIAGFEVAVAWALVISGIALLLRLVGGLVSISFSARLAEEVGTSMRSELARAFLSTAWAIQQNQPAGRLQQLLTSFVSQCSMAVSSFTGMLSVSLNLTALLVVAIVVDPVASLLVIIASVVIASILAPIRLRIRLRSRTSSRAELRMSNIVSEFGHLGLEMQTFGVKDEFLDLIEETSKEFGETERRAGVLRNALPQIYTSMAFGAILLGLVVAASVGVNELSSIGAVMLVMVRSLNFGQQLQTHSANLAGSAPFLEELETTITNFRENAASRGKVEVDRVGVIEAQDVSFSYAPDRPVLCNVNFVIQPGEIIGVIGPSGAGKSTLVQLLLGVRSPTAGTITFGGIDLRDVERKSWVKSTSVVPQDPQLFTGSVADNIRFLRDRVDAESIRTAAEQANVAQEIDAMANGFDTHIGEKGQQLSGGQRQRISIARALAGQPRFLILDEPTSSLDVHSESLIRETLVKLRGEVTIVIIAHRMSTLDMCDRLMVIEGGLLRAFDTPEHLRDNSEFYRQALELSGIT